MKHIIYNGAIIPESDFTTGISNRAFLYGDGLFETMIFRKGKISFFDDHFERITEGARILGMHISLEWNLVLLEQKITELCLKNNYNDTARIKLLIFRKPGGLVTPTSSEFDYLVFISDYIKPIAVKENSIFCDEVVICKTSYSKFKTCNFLPYIQASIFKVKMSVNEVIISDIFGNVAECSSSNIFWEKNGKVFTPSIDTGCIAGIMRKQIIQAAKDLGIDISEGKYGEKDLLDAEFVFTANSSGLSVLMNVKGKKFREDTTIYQKIVNRLGL